MGLNIKTVATWRQEILNLATCLYHDDDTIQVMTPADVKESGKIAWRVMVTSKHSIHGRYCRTLPYSKDTILFVLNETVKEVVAPLEDVMELTFMELAVQLRTELKGLPQVMC